MSQGCLRFRTYSPHPLLSSHVQSYWTMESTEPLPPNAVEIRYLHPDGGEGILFNYGDPVGTDRAPRPTGVVLGSRPVAPTTMFFTGKVKMAGVRFLPGGVYGLFRTASLSEEACGYRELGRLFDRIGDTRWSGGWARPVDSWLLRHSGRATLSATTAAAVRRILTSGGNVSVESVAELLGVSARHLERLFREQVGYSPKQLARIARARRAKSALAVPNAPSLSGLAYELGYADQSHFTREFRSLIGITPAAYRLCIESRRRAPSAAPMMAATRALRNQDAARPLVAQRGAKR